jgi:hypothetical protein
MRELLTTTEYMFYHALWQGGYPATIGEVVERLRKKPYEREITAVYAAGLVRNVERKRYLKSEKVQSGKVGQPPTSLRPLVPLSEVVRAHAERAVGELAWDDREALNIILDMVEEALALAPKQRRTSSLMKRPARVVRTRVGRREPL